MLSMQPQLRPRAGGRRAKTDRIDGETLLRALVAQKRGEPRVCSMVRALTPEDKDRRRIAPILDFATQAIGHGSFSHQL